MDSVPQLLEQLDDEIDDLEDSLLPILDNALSQTLSKLPVLDKAKLYVLLTYAIESVIFSYLRLNGVKAREHPVFRELTRVKQYFEKIKSAETPLPKRENLVLDKAAASRFIKAALSGNDKYDLEVAERVAKERARAQLKAENLVKKQEVVRTHIKFDDQAEQEVESSPTNAQDVPTSDLKLESKASSDLEVAFNASLPKKRKPDILSPNVPDSESLSGGETEMPAAKRKKGKGLKSKKAHKVKEDNTGGR